MPIGISYVAAYRSVGSVWAILCSIITVLYSNVPMGTYCFVSCYLFPLENVDIRLRL